MFGAYILICRSNFFASDDPKLVNHVSQIKNSLISGSRITAILTKKIKNLIFILSFLKILKNNEILLCFLCRIWLLCHYSVA